MATTLSEPVVAGNGAAFSGSIGIVVDPRFLPAAIPHEPLPDIAVEPTADGLRLMVPSLHFAVPFQPVAYVAYEGHFVTNAHTLTAISPNAFRSNEWIVLADYTSFRLTVDPSSADTRFTVNVDERGDCAGAPLLCRWDTPAQTIDIHASLPEPSTWVLLLTGVGWLARPWKTS